MGIYSSLFVLTSTIAILRTAITVFKFAALCMHLPSVFSALLSSPSRGSSLLTFSWAVVLAIHYVRLPGIDQARMILTASSLEDQLVAGEDEAWTYREE